MDAKLRSFIEAWFGVSVDHNNLPLKDSGRKKTFAMNTDGWNVSTGVSVYMLLYMMRLMEVLFGEMLLAVAFI